MYEVVLTELAETDIKSALSYISKELKNPQAATLLSDTRKAFRYLSSMPQRCAFVRDETLAHEGIRYICVRNYMMFCAVREESTPSWYCAFFTANGIGNTYSDAHKVILCKGGDFFKNLLSLLFWGRGVRRGYWRYLSGT